MCEAEPYVANAELFPLSSTKKSLLSDSSNSQVLLPAMNFL